MRPAGPAEARSFEIIGSRIRFRRAMWLGFLETGKRAPCSLVPVTPADLGFIDGRRRLLFELVLAAFAQYEHRQPENEKNDSPPEIRVDTEAPGVDGIAVGLES